MSRAKLFHVPDLIWHLTHRCHNQDFLLKFHRDKRRLLFWLFQAKKRYKLCILNYAITSNHIHLLTYDTGRIHTIPRSIQLTAGRTGREFNNRKKRSGAFWEDSYHSTAVESGKHLLNCMIYIDLNMVRAGVVKHPKFWAFSGFCEIVYDKKRYRLIDKSRLLSLLGISSEKELQVRYKAMIDNAVREGNFARNEIWTKNYAVGSEEYIHRLWKRMGGSVVRKKLEERDGVFTIKENQVNYVMDNGQKKKI